MIRIILFFILIQYLIPNGFTQDAINNKNCNYAKEPCWISMMDEPNVNYFEAQKAFNEFWKARGGEPFVSENAEERNQHLSKKKSQKEQKKESDDQKYVIEYKKFKNWLEEVKPYVQEDGHILSIEERKNLYEKPKVIFNTNEYFSMQIAIIKINIVNEFYILYF